MKCIQVKWYKQSDISMIVWQKFDSILFYHMKDQLYLVYCTNSYFVLYEKIIKVNIFTVVIGRAVWQKFDSNLFYFSCEICGRGTTKNDQPYGLCVQITILFYIYKKLSKVSILTVIYRYGCLKEIWQSLILLLSQYFNSYLSNLLEITSFYISEPTNFNYNPQ